jgi:hypothetical protein
MTETQTPQTETGNSKKQEVLATIASFVVMAAIMAVADQVKDKSGKWVKHQIAPKADTN